MDALLEIGRRLIEERGIDDVTMSEVATSARSSVGALYFRFGNRDGFFDEVFERQLALTRRDFERHLAGLPPAPNPAVLMTGFVRWLVGAYLQNRGLMRAQLRRAMEKPQTMRSVQAFLREMVERVIAKLEPVHKPSDGSDWKMHVRIVIQIVVGNLNNILINSPGPLNLEDDNIADELGQVVVRYLRLETAGDKTSLGGAGKGRPAARKRARSPRSTRRQK